MHPGVCATELTADMREASSNLSKALGSLSAGAAFRLKVSKHDGEFFAFKMKAFSERGDRQVVLLDCDLIDIGGGSLVVSPKVAENEGFLFEVGEKSIRDIWRVCGGPPAAVEVSPLVATAPSSVDACCTIPQYRSDALAKAASDEGNLFSVWPPPPAPPSPPCGPSAAPRSVRSGRDLVIGLLRRSSAGARFPAAGSAHF